MTNATIQDVLDFANRHYKRPAFRAAGDWEGRSTTFFTQSVMGFNVQGPMNAHEARRRSIQRHPGSRLQYGDAPALSFHWLDSEDGDLALDLGNNKLLVIKNGHPEKVVKSSWINRWNYLGWTDNYCGYKVEAVPTVFVDWVSSPSDGKCQKVVFDQATVAQANARIRRYDGLSDQDLVNIQDSNSAAINRLKGENTTIEKELQLRSNVTVVARHRGEGKTKNLIERLRKNPNAYYVAPTKAQAYNVWRTLSAEAPNTFRRNHFLGASEARETLLGVYLGAEITIYVDEADAVLGQLLGRRPKVLALSANLE